MKGKGTILVPFVVLFLSLFLSQNLPAGGQLSVVSEQWSVNNNQSGRDEPQCKRQDNRESCIVNHASDNKSEIQNPQLEKEKFAQKTRKLQIPFIANSGHVDERVKFYANTFGGTVFVTKDGEIVYALPKHEKTEGRSQNTRSSVVDRDSKSEFQNPKSGIALREEFVGARVKAIKGEEKSVTKVNYFKGNDPSKWKTDISTYDMVNLGEIYKGIELKLKAYGDNIEKLFYVKPGADTERIRLRLSGGKDFNINNKGELEVETELGPVKFTKPVAYQEINGRRVEVSVEYRVESSEAENKSSKHKTCNSKLMSTNPKLDYGFRVASYDKSHDLIIDPLLASTFLGGSGDDTVKSIAIDSDGNVYVAGYTKSSDFPTTTGSYDTSYNGSYDTDDEDYDTDVFVSKLSGDLTSLLASTYLGGSSDDWVNSIAIDSGGNIYVTGETYATDFPTTTGSYDTSYNKNDAFVSKLNGDLTTLLASTYLGGSSDDWVNSIAIDSGGNIYVTGGTYATDFPTTTGAYDISYNGVYDAFVSKFSSNLTSLIASTYLGGDYYDFASSIAIDSDGNIYVTGGTFATGFPTTSGAYDTSRKGDGEIFVSKLSGDLTSLHASTFLGGSHPDSEISYDFDSYATSITIDPSGNIFVTGETHSSDFPTTTGAYDTSYNGSGDEYSSDVFVSKLNSTLTTLLASTYLGGSFSDWANSMAIDSEGNVYVTGKANSLNFPTTTGAYDTSYNDYSDSFISKLSGDLTTLLASTYLGGLSIGNSIAVDSGGNIYVAGATSSKNFPTTTGAYDTSYNKDDAFVSKFDSNLSASSTTSSGISWPVDNFEKSKITTKGTSYRGSYGSPCTNKSMDPYEAGAGRHPGIDYPISTGTPIKAMADGIIDLTIKRNLDGSDPSKENKNGGWGGLVIIRHDQFGGVYSIYAHLSEYSKKLIKQKKPGKTEITVKKGDIIGKSGGTGPWKGNSDGNHLHFQIDRAGNKVVPWFPSKWPAWAKDKTPFKWWWKNKCHETSAVNIPDDWQRYDDNDESGSPYYSEKNKEHADYPKDENNYYESLGGQVLEYTYDPIQFIEDRL